MDENQYASFGRTAFSTVSGSKLARIRQHAGHSILDVGCGPGLYLERLANLGYQVTGVDGNSIFVQKALRFTDRVFQIDLDREGLARFPDSAFETVLLLDVLEHVADDKRLLREAARIANRNVLLSVPAQVPEGMKNTQLVFASYVDPTHRRYYTYETLQETLAEIGFASVSIEGALGFTPILYDLFPNHLKYPLKMLNRFVKRFSDPKLLTSVWFAVGSKSIPTDKLG